MHLVESMAYAGERPWHGLGNKLTTLQPIDVWKRQAGMDWTIEESEVRFITGSQTVGAIHSFPEQKVLYRSDTKRPLAVVSKRFQVVQPEEVLEFYRDLTEDGGFEWLRTLQTLNQLPCATQSVFGSRAIPDAARGGWMTWTTVRCRTLPTPAG